MVLGIELRIANCGFVGYGLRVIGCGRLYPRWVLYGLEAEECCSYCVALAEAIALWMGFICIVRTGSKECIALLLPPSGSSPPLPLQLDPLAVTIFLCGWFDRAAPVLSAL